MEEPSQLDGADADALPPAWDATEALTYCEGLTDLTEQVKRDLAPWAESGIDRALMRASIDRFSVRGGNKGVALAFRNGTAYVVDGRLKGPISHHASAFFAYMHVMQELQQLFGNHIPDVEFVLATSDRPMVLLDPASDGGRTGPPLPVLRFCSSPAHADIQVPIFHFTTKKYTQKMLAGLDALGAEYPWSKRQERLFGRFSVYPRYISPHVPQTARRGADNQDICKADTPETTVCAVRTHAIAWAANHTDLLDVRSAPRVPMPKHASWKYLLHLDGQALSSRIDMLLPLNSTVFKEESGYTTFYYHLLKPGVHYVPVWKDTPEDMLTAVEWAKAHDDEARRIAAAGQAFALRYLGKKPRTCYWLALLTEMSKLLRYEVSPGHDGAEAAAAAARRARRRGSGGGGGMVNVGATGVRPGVAEQQAMPHAVEAEPDPDAGIAGYMPPGAWRTVEDYLRDVAPHFEGGKWFMHRVEAF